MLFDTGLYIGQKQFLNERHTLRANKLQENMAFFIQHVCLVLIIVCVVLNVLLCSQYIRFSNDVTCYLHIGTSNVFYQFNTYTNTRRFTLDMAQYIEKNNSKNRIVIDSIGTFATDIVHVISAFNYICNFL